MQSALFRSLALLLVAFLVACGADEEGSDDTGVNEDIPENADAAATESVNSLRLLVDQRELESGSNDSITLTALARDSDNVVVEGAAVEFTTPDSEVSIVTTQGVTDESGSAEATLSLLAAPSSATNRTFEVSAQVNSTNVTDTVNVSVTGTEVSLSGDRSLAVGNAGEYQLTLRDSTGSPIPDREFTLESSLGNTLTPNRQETDRNGVATFVLNAEKSGSDIITASADGDTTSLSVNLSDDSFSLTAPAEEQEIDINTAEPVTLAWTSDDINTSNKDINFATTRGDFSGNTVVTEPTGSNGEATTAVQSSTSGFATITALTADSTNKNLSTSRTVQFIAKDPDSISVQALPRSIAPNSGGETANRSTITAIVRDASGNLVANKDIAFNTADLGVGTLKPQIAKTDDFGRATTEFIAGEVPTGFEGVTVEAVVVDETSVTGDVSLTVADSSFITIGSSGVLQTENPNRYRQPQTVQVTNVDGTPAANEEVSLALRTTSVIVGNDDPGTPDNNEAVWAYDGEVWVSPLQTVVCPTTQFGTASIVPDEGTETRTENGKVILVTDDEGYADFDVVYPPSEGSWSNVEVVASADVGDTYEARSSYSFTLPVLQDALEDEASPPFQVSPYGSDGNCP